MTVSRPCVYNPWIYKIKISGIFFSLLALVSLPIGLLYSVMPQASTYDADVLIVGAGLTGLTAALHLHRQDISIRILEATERVGGRIKTDQVDGYLLDRGFQVLLTQYPETQQWLDYDALDLKPFAPGAMILNERGKHEIMDPGRIPTAAFKTLVAPVGSLADKLRMLRLKNRLKAMSLDDIFAQPEISTLAAIQEYGFSERMLRNFFQPFMAGIFLENGLITSRRAFDFVFKMFSEGDTAVPALGMEEIPRQLATQLPADAVLFHKHVRTVSEQTVTTNTGETFTAPIILVATEPTSFVSRYFPGGKKDLKYQSTTQVYLTADTPPFTKPVIALNAKNRRLVNNFTVMNQVAPAYAPKGKHLLSAAIVGDATYSDEELPLRVREEMALWFGEQTTHWRPLKTYRITYALPHQEEVSHTLAPEQSKLRDGLYAAGDYRLNGSINAAMRAGRQVAERIAEERKQGVMQ